jgi:hypothetical protein
MSINQTIWGVENPTKAHKLKILAIFVLLALMFFGFYCDFIPSEDWLVTGSAISAIVSMLFIGIVWWRHWTGRQVLSYKNIESKLSKIFITYILFPFVVSMLIWVSMVHGFASGINIIFGKPKEAVTMLVKSHKSSRRSCDYRLEGEYLSKAFPSYICISQEYYEASPKNVSVKLSGKETYFGFLVQNFHE